MRKLLLPIFVSLLALPALAAPKTEQRQVASRTSSTAVGMFDSSTIAATPSVSGLFSTGGNDWIQAFLTFGKTKSNVDFAGGGFYKFTVSGDRFNGFHVGPGVALGAMNAEFAFSFVAAVGAHFRLHERLLASIDGGPMLTHTKDNTNFRVRPVGDFLGLGLYYLF